MNLANSIPDSVLKDAKNSLRANVLYDQLLKEYNKYNEAFFNGSLGIDIALKNVIKWYLYNQEEAESALNDWYAEFHEDHPFWARVANPANTVDYPNGTTPDNPTKREMLNQISDWLQADLLTDEEISKISKTDFSNVTEIKWLWGPIKERIGK